MLGTKLIKAAAGSGAADGPDENFENTVLLLHGDGNQGATNFSNTGPTKYIAFTDNSTNNFPITVNGDAYGDNFSPFAVPEGNWSNFFDGSTQALSIANNAAFDLSSGSWTIEFWAYITGGSGYRTFVSKRGAATAEWELGIDPSGYFYFYTSTVYADTTVIPTNQWVHLAATYDGSNLRLFQNGVVTRTQASVTAGSGSAPVNIAHAYNGGGQLLPAYLSNVRVVKGTAVYTSAFTPSTTPLTAIANTSLLTCQSNRIVDNSTNAFSFTIYGSPKVSPFTPFTVTPNTTDGSGYFDGTGDYLQTGSNAALAPGSGDFTIECWLYPIGNSNYMGFYQNYTDGNGRSTALRMSIYQTDNTRLVVQTLTTELILTSTGVLRPNAWNHVALVRNGSGSNNLVLYVNGVSAGTATNTTNFSDGYAQIANTTYAGVNYTWNGYLSSMRVVPGTAVYTSAFTPPTSPLTAVTNTQLLTCQYAGSVRNVGFIDSGPYDFPITRVGNTTQGSFSPFSKPDGRWGNYFGGSSRLEVSSATVLGTGDVTVEFWFYPLKTDAAYYALYDGRSSSPSNTGLGIFQYGQTIEIYGNGLKVSSAATAFSGNTWVHFAVVRTSGTCQIYINGIASGSSATYSDNFTSTVRKIGINADLIANIYTGYISNLREVTSALYSGNFTPSTTPLTAISGTSLLTCQSNRFVDNSASPKTIAAGGAPKVTPFSPFPITTAYDPAVNGGAGYFDGSGDYLEMSDNASFQFGSNNFSVSFWAYATTSVTTNYIISQFATGNKGILFGIGASVSGKIAAIVSSTGSNDIVVADPDAFPVGSWVHVVFARNDTTLALFVNGTRKATSALSSGASLFDSTNLIRIGAHSQGAASTFFPGYIAGMQSVIGSTVPFDASQSTITIPTAPPTAITNTQLLCNFTNAGIFDNTGFNNLETVGNAQIDTSVVKYGTGSMKFDGSGDYLVVHANENLSFEGDFTIELWVKTSVSTVDTYYRRILCFGQDDTNNIQLVFSDGSNATTNLSVYSSSVLITGNIAVADGNWNHVAVSRSGSSMKLFINGVQSGSTATTTQNFNAGATRNLIIARYALAGGHLDGYIDDLRITKGIARYTSNFTPPDKELPNIGE